MPLNQYDKHQVISAYKDDIKNKVRVCKILKKYGITKPTYYRYKENFRL